MLKKRIEGLREAANDCISRLEWDSPVEMALKECEYELLCKHIDAIHGLIDQYTPKGEQKLWKRALLFLKNHSIPILVYSFALTLIILCFLLEPEYLDSNIAFSIALLSVIVPPLLTRLLS